MSARLVFFDIAGPDPAVQAAFYEAVLGLTIEQGGHFSTGVVSPMPALLRTDPPGVMVYFGVEDVTATLDKVVAAGGEVMAPRFEVPEVVVLGLFSDPAGNKLGLVEMVGDRPRIP